MKVGVGKNDRIELREMWGDQDPFLINPDIVKVG